MKRLKDRLHRVIVIGAAPSGIAAANKLGELGIPVTIVDSDADLNLKLSAEAYRLKSGVPLNFAHRPGLIRILRNPQIRCLMRAKVNSVKHNAQGFSVSITEDQTFVDPDRCILCGRCADACPVSVGDGIKAVRFNTRFSLPGRAVIDKRRLPLCRENCPLGVNAQGYIALAKGGKYAEALALIREANILPGVCGRICTHPCEDDCRRAQLDDAVAIRSIKRFLADYEADHPETVRPPEPVERRKERFAVIGSGPAGLAAAAKLAQHGCHTTVFEKEDNAGGLLRYGIGAHRLPRKILDAELDYIRQLGVTFVLLHPVDFSNDLENLRKDFDGVIIAAGSWKDRNLGVEGEDLDGVDGCIAFLSRFHHGQAAEIKDRAAVIGDGNAAFDLARTLRRIGADVTIVSWFEKDKIPADPEEIAAAEQEGISVVDKTKVVAFRGENGKLNKLVCKPTKPGTPDQNGVAWPRIVEGSAPFDLSFDKAFVAIGLTSPFKSDAAVHKNAFGYLQVDDGFRTNIAGVYAAGDAVTGPSTVVHAMSRGRAAAESMLADVCGIRIPSLQTQRPSDREFPEIPPDIPTQNRIPMPEMQAVGRKNNFSEVALGLSESQAMAEAGRCLQCGVCSECMACADACKAVGAICHGETAQTFTEQAGVIIVADPDMAQHVKGDDVIRAYGPKTSKPDVYAMIQRGFSAAANAAVLLEGIPQMQKGRGLSFAHPDAALTQENRIGVFVCKCNDSLGWREEMDAYIQKLLSVDHVVHAEAVTSACVPESTSAMVRTVRDKGVTRIVLASCVCCPLNFVCSACTDQRSRLKHNFLHATGISRSSVVTVNIRGESLSLLHREPEQAQHKFEGLIDRAIKLSHRQNPYIASARNYNFTTAVIGESEAAVRSASTLAEIGMDVFMFEAGTKAPEEIGGYPNIHLFENAVVNELSGTLGDFKLSVQTGDFNQNIHVGAVILGEKSRKRLGFVHQEGMPRREIACDMQEKGVSGIPFFYPGMTSISGLFLADPPGIRISGRQKGEAASILAASVMPRGPRKSKGHTVVIDKDICRNCGRCVDICPYQAVTLIKNDIGGWYASADQAFCKGCGNCISVCPSNAADSPYRNQKFFEQMLEEILLQ